MCNCMTWCRVPTDENGGKYPMSDHAPGCEDFKHEPFTRLELGGTTCVMEPREAEDLLAESDQQYTVTTVMLTRDQFDRMPEFNGF